MNNLDKFITALRSGKYSKSGGRLKSGDCYCAMGVACDLYIQDTGEGEWKYDRFIFFNQPYNAFVPYTVEVWLGVSEYSIETIMEMNDNGDSFEDIAIFLENQKLYDHRIT